MLTLIKKMLHKQEEVERYRRQSVVLASFYNEIENDDKDLNDGISCVIFSMDRAIQLHALLGSLFARSSSPITTFVIYRSTDPEHEKAYKEVISIFADQPVYFVKQVERSTFDRQLLDVLEKIGTTKLFFLVDDILVTGDIDVDDLKKVNCERCVMSLRMGKNLRFCSMVNRSEPLPTFIDLDGKPQKDKICWKWSDGQYDWNYPLSVDGHVFLTKEIIAMTKNIHFDSPNTYEGNLQIFKPIFDLRYGLAYERSKILNIPCNKVQTDNNNGFGTMHQDDLLAKWQAGEQIDFKALYGFENTDVHQDVAFNFKKRNAK
jgi:hypothetical protein